MVRKGRQALMGGGSYGVGRQCFGEEEMFMLELTISDSSHAATLRPFLTHQKHTETICVWQSCLGNLGKLFHYDHRRAVLLEEVLKRLQRFSHPAHPSTYSFWAFNPVYTKAFRHSDYTILLQDIGKLL